MCTKADSLELWFQTISKIKSAEDPTDYAHNI